ncbi:hypothetical protein HMPREF1326_00753 [Akkermansia sp. KLE1605]|nr:hypothetical protein HMPREF1326_00753 [Akkermansia sp. KLE1605]
MTMTKFNGLLLLRYMVYFLIKKKSMEFLDLLFECIMEQDLWDILLS